jgi:hypothetical protein
MKVADISPTFTQFTGLARISQLSIYDAPATRVVYTLMPAPTTAMNTKDISPTVIQLGQFHVTIVSFMASQSFHGIKNGEDRLSKRKDCTGNVTGNGDTAARRSLNILHGVVDIRGVLLW